MIPSSNALYLTYFGIKPRDIDATNEYSWRGHFHPSSLDGGLLMRSTSTNMNPESCLGLFLGVSDEDNWCSVLLAYSIIEC